MKKRNVKRGVKLTAGMKFRTSAGVDGVVLKRRSPRGKMTARLNCSVEGCKATHVRESSDWWQSDRCRDHNAYRFAKKSA